MGNRPDLSFMCAQLSDAFPPQPPPPSRRVFLKYNASQIDMYSRLNTSHLHEHRMCSLRCLSSFGVHSLGWTIFGGHRRVFAMYVRFFLFHRAQNCATIFGIDAIQYTPRKVPVLSIVSVLTERLCLWIFLAKEEWSEGSRSLDEFCERLCRL